MENRVKEQLLKIKRLADEGCDGEASAAANMLERMCRKHGVSLDELLEKETERVYFTYRDRMERALLTQLAFLVAKENVEDGYWRCPGKQRMGFDLTPAEKIDLEIMFEHYRPLLKREFEETKSRFKTAFFHKHNLLVEADEDEELPPIRQEDIMAIMSMMQTMRDDNGPRKRLCG